MNYYVEIKNKLIGNKIYSKVKDYSKERHKGITYFEIGKLLSEAGSKYGENIIIEWESFIKCLTIKKTPLVSKLNWSQYLQVLSIKKRRRNYILYQYLYKTKFKC